MVDAGGVHNKSHPSMSTRPNALGIHLWKKMDLIIFVRFLKYHNTYLTCIKCHVLKLYDYFLLHNIFLSDKLTDA